MVARIRIQKATDGCGCQTISGKRVMENGKMHGWKQSVRRRMAILTGMTLLAGGLLAGCSGGISTQKTEKGYRAVKDADFQSAQQDFETAVTEGEDAVQAYRGLGIALMGQAKYKDAVDAFNKALAATDEKMPDTVKDLLLYRESAEYRGADYAAVIKTAESLIGMDEKMKEPYFYRGAAYLYQGEQDKAKTNFDYAVSLDPSNYSLYLNIYRVYNDNHLSAVGDEYLQTALGTEPSDAEGYYQVGQIYYYLEQYDEAAKALVEPIKEKNVPAMSLMGQIYLARKDYDNAKAIYTQVQSIDPSSTDSYNGLALCALAQDDVQTALQYIAQGLALPGNEGKQDLYFNEVVAYEKSLDFLTAKDKCQKYVELYPTDEKGQRELTFLNSRN